MLENVPMADCVANFFLLRSKTIVSHFQLPNIERPIGHLQYILKCKDLEPNIRDRTTLAPKYAAVYRRTYF